MNKSQELVAMMIRDKECADFIEFGWNALYNDLIECRMDWDKLSPISAMAIQDWYEHKMGA